MINDIFQEKTETTILNFPERKPDEEFDNYLEFLSLAQEIYEKALASRNDEDYEVNSVQMRKYETAISFFKKLADEGHGVLEESILSPKRQNATLEFYVNPLLLYDENVTQFAKILGYACSLSFNKEPDDTICIGMVIPDVFTKK